MAGDGHIPPKMLDPKVLQAVCDHPKRTTPVIQTLMDEVKYTMWANNKVKVALWQYFNVESIAILSVDTKKEKKAFTKFIKSNPECTGAIKATFVSALCDLFVVLINVLQYGESQYTKTIMLSLEIHQDIIKFVKEAAWILKMPLDHRTTSRTLQDKDKTMGSEFAACNTPVAGTN